MCWCGMSWGCYGWPVISAKAPHTFPPPRHGDPHPLFPSSTPELPHDPRVLVWGDPEGLPKGGGEGGWGRTVHCVYCSDMTHKAPRL